jgi:hypothetical protein
MNRGNMCFRVNDVFSLDELRVQYIRVCNVKRKWIFFVGSKDNAKLCEIKYRWKKADSLRKHKTKIRANTLLFIV